MESEGDASAPHDAPRPSGWKLAPPAAHLTRRGVHRSGSSSTPSATLAAMRRKWRSIDEQSYLERSSASAT